MTNYYDDFRKAERLGVGSIKDLYYVLLSTAEEERNVSKVNQLFDTIADCATFSNRKAQRIYEEIEKDLLCWIKEKCVINDYGEVVSFKGE